MGCIYCSNMDGKCELFDPEHPIDVFGCDEEGNCVVEDDPDPSVSCENYKSDGSGFGEDDEDEDEYEVEEVDVKYLPGQFLV